jgi:hypothetical protein
MSRYSLYTLPSKWMFDGTIRIPYCSTISLVRRAMLSATMATISMLNDPRRLNTVALWWSVMALEYTFKVL